MMHRLVPPILAVTLALAALNASAQTPTLQPGDYIAAVVNQDVVAASEVIQRTEQLRQKARQQGVVTVRFTVHADGRISGSSIRTSSGHDLLDQATLDLMERVAPLPRFPRSMTRDRVTISLPIDYSLRTK